MTLKVETQNEKVLRLLREYPEGVCANVFLQERIPRFGGRLYDLKKQGYIIEKRRCFAPSHRHGSRQYRYVLVGGI